MSAPNEVIELALLGMLPDQDTPSTAHVTTFELGMAIARDPQVLVAALADAGILRAITRDNLRRPANTWYMLAVPVPHVHTWRVAMGVDNVNAHVGTTVRLICHECHETTDVTNQLPIEIP